MRSARSKSFVASQGRSMAKKLAARPTSAAGSFGAASTLRFARNQRPQASRAACDAGAEFMLLGLLLRALWALAASITSPRTRVLAMWRHVEAVCSCCRLLRELKLRTATKGRAMGPSMNLQRSVLRLCTGTARLSSKLGTQSLAQKSQFVLRTDVV